MKMIQQQNKLEDMDLRVELDDRAESIGYKIREANGKYKIPMQLIIGKNEAENRKKKRGQEIPASW